MQRRSFMKLMATSAAGVGAAGVVSGCKLKGNSGNNIRPYVRMISVATGQKFTTTIYNGSTTGSVLNNSITLDTTSTGTPNGAFSEYQQVDWEGGYVISLLPPGTSTSNPTGVLGGASLSPAQGSHYTGYAYLSPTSSTSSYALNCSIVNDDAPTVSSGQYVIRMLNTVSNPATSIAYDLYLTTGGTTSSSLPVGSNSDLAGTSATVSGSGYGVGVVSNYSTGANAGTFRLRLTKATTQTVVFDSDNVVLANGGAYTLVTYSLGSALLPTVMLVTPSGDPVILTNNLTRIRVVQGSSDIVNVTSQIVIGTGAAQTTEGSFTFGNTSLYSIQPAGKVPVTFTVNNGATSPYLTVNNQSFIGGQDYVVYSVGASSPAGTANYLAMIDNNLPVASASYSVVTYANATPVNDPQASSVDYTLDGTQSTSPVATGAAATATQVSAQTDHVVKFLDHTHNHSPLAQVDVGTVIAGGIYTVALIGTGNSTLNGTFSAVSIRTDVL